MSAVMKRKPSKPHTLCSLVQTEQLIASSFVSYPGQSGKSYYAVATFWAGKDGGGDTKTYTTAEVTAK